MKPQNIQVPLKLLTNVHVLMAMLDNVILDEDTRALCVEIEAMTQAKIDAINKRNVYSNYKTAQTPEEREQYRNKYLNKAGIQPDFRPADETSYKPEVHII